MPHVKAAENNKGPILAVLRECFADVHEVLEIASGTGQHAVHFATHMPHLTWHPSELPEHLPHLQARLDAEAPDNVKPAIALDVADLPWPVEKVDGLFASNCVHIISWPLVEKLFEGIGQVIASGGVVCFYGAYKYNGAFTTKSNAKFDAWLKSRDPSSGVRDFEAVNTLAERQGLQLERDVPMPNNNQSLIWRRS